MNGNAIDLTPITGSISAARVRLNAQRDERIAVEDAAIVGTLAAIMYHNDYDRKIAHRVSEPGPLAYAMNNITIAIAAQAECGFPVFAPLPSGGNVARIVHPDPVRLERLIAQAYESAQYPF